MIFDYLIVVVAQKPTEICKHEIMLVEAIRYSEMGSEIGNGACKCYDQYGPQKRLIPKNVSPLAFKIWRAHPARVASTFLRCC